MKRTAISRFIAAVSCIAMLVQNVSVAAFAEAIVAPYADEVTEETVSPVVDMTVQPDVPSAEPDVSAKRLLVCTDDEALIAASGIPAALSGFDGVYLLCFDSEEDTREAYYYYSGAAASVEADIALYVADDAYVQNEAAEPDAMVYADALTWLSVLLDENGIDGAEAQKQYDIALVDTGTAENTDGVSVIGGSAADDNGHAGEMYEAIRSISPDASVLSVKAFDSHGIGSISSVYAAILYAAEKNVSVIDLSFAAESAADSPVLERAVSQAREKGITVIGAAGNNDSDIAGYIPGRVPGVTVAGACDEAGVKRPSSNYGEAVFCNVAARSTSEAAARLAAMAAAYGMSYVETEMGNGIVFRCDGAEADEVPPASEDPSVNDLFDPSELTEETLHVIRKGVSAAAGEPSDDDNTASGGSSPPQQTPQRGNGLTIEHVYVHWLSKGDAGSEPYGTLELAPEGQMASNQQFQIDFDLSGQYPHEPGSVEITIPAYLWTDRDGEECGTLTLSVPEAPETGAEFAWKRVGDTIVITNVKTLPAASKVMLQGTFRNVDATEIPDDDSLKDFHATVTVVASDGETISMESNTIHARMDTHIQAKSADKTAYDGTTGKYTVWWGEAPAEMPSELLKALPPGADPSEYMFVRWFVSGEAEGNQPFSMYVNDTIETDENGEPLGVMLGVSNCAEKNGYIVSQDGKTVSALLYDGFTDLPRSAYVWTAYKQDYFTDANNESILQTLTNEQTISVTGWDDGVTSEQSKKADITVKKPTTYTFTKQWNDKDAEAIHRPDHMFIKIKSQPGDKVLTIRLTAEKNTDPNDPDQWVYTWSDNGQDLKYTLEEILENAEGYDLEYYDQNYHQYKWKYYLNQDEDAGYKDGPTEWFFPNDYEERWLNPGEDNVSGSISYIKKNSVYAFSDTQLISKRDNLSLNKLMFNKAVFVPYTIDTDVSAAAQYLADRDKTTVFTLEDTKYTLNGNNSLNQKEEPDMDIGAVRFSVPKVYQYQETPVSENVPAGSTWYEKVEAATPRTTVYGLMRDGSWVALAEWTPSAASRNGELKAVYDGVAISDDMRIELPAGFTGIRVQLAAAAAFVHFECQPEIRIYPTDDVKAMIEACYVGDNEYAMLYLSNQANSYAAETVDAEKHYIDQYNYSDAFLHGKLYKIAADLTKDFTLAENDIVKKQLVLHASIEMTQQSNILSLEDFREAAASGEIPCSRGGTYYDLLPHGVDPDLGTIRLTPGDSLISASIKTNYKDSGRTLLVVKVAFAENFKSASSSKYKDDPSYPAEGYKSSHTLEFDSYILHNTFFNDPDVDKEKFHNIAAFEAQEDSIGSIKGWVGEVDDPTGSWSENTNQHKHSEHSGNDKERDWMKDLNTAHKAPSFVYAGSDVKHDEIDMVQQSSLDKYVKADGFGSWASGTGKDDPVNVQEGGRYIYRLQITATQANTKNIIVIDSLENYQLKPDDLDQEDAEKRWHGQLESIDLSAAKAMEIDPVVYYYTGSGYPDVADYGGSTEIVLNNLSVENGWVRDTEENPVQMAEVKAVAFDLRTKIDKTPFVLEEREAVPILLYMRAPYEMVDAPEYLDPKNGADATMNGHAYNEIYMSCTHEPDSNDGSDYSYLNHYYTKVGIYTKDIVVRKVWDDGDNRDGWRPEKVVAELLENGKPTGKKLTLNDENAWSGKFSRLQTYDENNKFIEYTIQEVPDENGKYTVQSDLSYENGNMVFTLTNYYEPEKISIPVTKNWTWEQGDDGEAALPDSITFRLTADGKETDRILTIKPDASGNWYGEFKDLFKNSAKDTPIVYEVTEDPITDFVQTGFEEIVETTPEGEQQKSYVFTNKYHPYGDVILTKKVDDSTLESRKYSKAHPFLFTLLLYTEDEPGVTSVVTNQYPYYLYTEPSPGDSEGYQTLDDYLKAIEDGAVEPAGSIGSSGTLSLYEGQHIIIKNLPSKVKYTLTESAKKEYELVKTADTEGTVRSGVISHAEFTNRYITKGTAQLDVTKVLTGRELRGYQFRFELYELRNGEKVLVRTANNSAGGSVAFNLPYSNEHDGNTYTYYITEVDTGLPGYEYSGREYRVEVEPLDKGDGTMSCTVTYYDEQGNIINKTVDGKMIEGKNYQIPVFKNEYHASGEVKLLAWKDLDGRSLKKDEFTFDLYDQAFKKLSTKKNTADGVIIFDALPFNETHDGKTFRFYAVEQKGSDETVIYDASWICYEITVMDKGDGNLEFMQSSYILTRGGGLHACPECKGKGKREDNTFCEVCHGIGDMPDDYWLTACTDCEGTGKNKDNTDCETCHGFGVVFDSLMTTACSACKGTGKQNAMPCTACHGFGIVIEDEWLCTECNGTGKYFMPYDCELCHGTGVVVDKKAFWIKPAVSVTPVFNNSLVDGSLSVTKKAVNMPDPYNDDKTFTFHIRLVGDKIKSGMKFKDTDGNIYQTDDNGEFTVEVEIGQTITFVGIPAGTAYQVWEEDKEGWYLSGSVSASGLIEAGEISSAILNNTYDPNMTKAIIVGTKLLDNKPAYQDSDQNTFRFEITEYIVEETEDGKTTERLVKTVTVPATDGGFIQYEASYQEAGTYIYKIKEVIDDNPDINYDTHEEIVTVVVTKVGEFLKATVTYDNDGVQFRNLTAPGALQINKVGNGVNNANNKLFTFEVSFFNENGIPFTSEELHWYVMKDKNSPDPEPSAPGGEDDEQTPTDENNDEPPQAKVGKIVVNRNSFIRTFDTEPRKAPQKAPGKIPGLQKDGETEYQPPDISTLDRSAATDNNKGTNGTVNWYIIPTDRTVTSGSNTVPEYVLLFEPASGGSAGAFSTGYADNDDNNGFKWQKATHYKDVTAILTTGNLSLSGVKSAQSMFNNCTNLVYADLSGIDFSYNGSGNDGELYKLFEKCNNLTTVNFSGSPIKGRYTLFYMFDGCSKLTTVNGIVVEYSGTKEVNLQGMFQNCSALTSIKLTNWKILGGAKLKAPYIFTGCPLLYVDMSGWEANIDGEFNLANLLNSRSSLLSADLSGWKFSGAGTLDLTQGFYNCTGMTAADLSGWNFSEDASVNMDRTFYGCTAATSIDFSGWNHIRITKVNANGEQATFTNCKSLLALDLTGWDTSQVTHMRGLFNFCNKIKTLDITGWNTTQVTNMQDMFARCWVLPAITGIDDLDTDSVTTMASMFREDTALLELDLRTWKTGNVTDMQHMFDMYYYGSPGSKLTDIYLGSGWDTSQVTSMNSMFNRCEMLETLDVSGFRTSKVTDMNSMFSYCNAIPELDVSEWDTGLVTDMKEMFARCNVLTQLKGITNWDTGSVVTMSHMFRECYALTSLDLSGWDTRNVETMESMFNMYGRQSALKTLILSGENWNTEKVTNMNSMFSMCSALEVLDIGTFSTKSVTNANEMFKSCDKIKEITVNWNFYGSLDTSGKFGYNTVVYNSIKSNTPGGKVNNAYRIWVNKEYLNVIDENLHKTGMFYELAEKTDLTDTPITYVWDLLSYYTIHFDPGAPEGSYIGFMRDGISAPDADYFIPANEYIRHGFIFTGWKYPNGESVTKDDDGRYYILHNTYSDGDVVTLTAQWVKYDEKRGIPYFIDIYKENKNYHEGDPPENRYYLAETRTDFKPEDKENPVTVTPPKMEFYLTPASQTVTISADSGVVHVPFYYDLIRFTIQFEGNDPDVTNSMDPIEMVGDEAYMLTNGFLNGTKRFISWNTQSDGKGDTFDAVTYYTTNDFDIPADKKLTLYAIWYDYSEKVDATAGKITVQCYAGETIVFPKLPAGTTYLIREIDLPDGWQWVPAESGGGELTEDGEIRGTILSNAYAGVKMTNTYSAKGAAVLEAHKQLDGDTLQGDDFTFELISLSEATVSKTGNFTGDGELEGLLYPHDDTTDTVHIEDAEGLYVVLHYYTFEESASVQVYDAGNTLIETLQGSGTKKFGITGSSVRFGTIQGDGIADYYAEVYSVHTETAANGLPDPYEEITDSDYNTVKNEWYRTGLVTFPTQNFTAPGEYVYYIRERNAGVDTIIYDEHIVKAVVKVTDNGNGVLSSSISYSDLDEEGNEAPANGARFINLKKTGQLAVSKTLIDDSGEVADTEFTFRIYLNDASGNPISGSFEIVEGDFIIPQDDGTSETTTAETTTAEASSTETTTTETSAAETTTETTATTMIEFTNGEATLTIKGGQKFTILGLPHGAVYTVEEEALPCFRQETATGNSGTILNGTTPEVAFINTYQTSGDVQFTAYKEFIGGDLSQYTFEFELVDSAGHVLQTATSDNNGVIAFAKIGYTQADIGKSFRYYIREVTGQNENILYDTKEKCIVVYVFRDADNQLQTTAEILDETTGESVAYTDKIQLKFTNILQYDLTVSKSVTGAFGDLGKKFRFTLLLENDVNQLPEKILCKTSAGTEERVLDQETPLTFELSDCELITFIGLPSGTQYTITEAENPDYDVGITVIGDTSPSITGSIVSGTLSADVSVMYLNTCHIEGYLPGAGYFGGTGWLYRLGTVVTLSGLLQAVLYVRRRRRGD